MLIERRMKCFADKKGIRRKREVELARELPIALRKGKRICAKYSISQYMIYENLSQHYKAFITQVDKGRVSRNCPLSF